MDERECTAARGDTPAPGDVAAAAGDASLEVLGDGPGASGDGSDPLDLGDASPDVVGDAYLELVATDAPPPALATARTRPLCGWPACRAPIPLGSRKDSFFCSRKCRQKAYRIRARASSLELAGRPMRVAYADPPFPDLAFRFYGDELTYAGEVDHRELVARLMAGGFDGWALSTSARALRDVLPLCPPETRVCAWCKPHGAVPATNGIHNCWEPVLVYGGRQRAPGVRDWLKAHAARGGGELPGRKPLAFCAWLFDLLGMAPGDELEDLFPGTGVVSAAWAELSRTALQGRRLPAAPYRRRTYDVVRFSVDGSVSRGDVSPSTGDASSSSRGDAS